MSSTQLNIAKRESLKIRDPFLFLGFPETKHQGPQTKQRQKQLKENKIRNPNFERSKAVTAKTPNERWRVSEWVSERARECILRLGRREGKSDVVPRGRSGIHGPSGADDLFPHWASSRENLWFFGALLPLVVSKRKMRECVSRTLAL